jgi:hypothetical protein
MANAVEKPVKRNIKKIQAAAANSEKNSCCPEADIPFREILKREGIDPALVCSVIREGLTAVKKDEPDFAARFRYLELSLQLLGIIPIEKKEAKTFDFTGKCYENLTDAELEAEYRARIEDLRFSPDKL